MSKGRFLNKRNEMLLRKNMMIFMIFLMFVSSFLPSVTLQVQALENHPLEEPNVSKDVEGDESKEVKKGEDHQYHVSIELPENIEAYDTVKISDQVDNRITVQEISLFIDEKEVEVEEVHRGKEQEEVEEQDEKDFQVFIDEQEVLLELKREQLEGLTGKTIKLQVTAQVKEDVTVGESIESIAKVFLNDDVEMETNAVFVTPVDTEAIEAETEGVDELDSAESKEVAKESTEEDKEIEATEEVEEVEEKEDQVEEPEKASSAENNSVKSKEKKVVQQENTDGITMNEVDSYLIGSGYILQIDGNDPSILKGKVQIDNNSINNSLAVDINEDVFYANAGSRLYKIYPDGRTELEATLKGNTAAGAITPDGNEYVYAVSAGDQLSLEFYDLDTKEERSIPIQDHTGFADLNGGDFAFDQKGNLWFSRWKDSPTNSILAKVDIHTGDLESVIPIISNTDRTFSRAGAMSFLPNEKLLILGNYTPGVGGGGYLLELDPATGVATEVRPNDFGLGIQDAASRIYPVLHPDVEIEKSVTPSGTVARGDELTYTLKIANSGNLASTLTTITDTLPSGTTYVANSTTLNGLSIEDDNGESPLFTGMFVNSPNESYEGVLYAGPENEATVTFKVSVNEDVHDGDEIINIATVGGADLDDVPSNEVITTVEDTPLPEPPNACDAPVSLINGSFEEGPERGSYNNSYMFLASEVPGWNTTDNSQGVEIIEIWDYQRNFPELVQNFPVPPNGNRYAELNAYENGLLYQDVETTPGQTIYWRLSHMGRQGVDTMQLRIGKVTDDPYDTTVMEQMSDGNTAWGHYSGSYTVPAGQTLTRFGFEAVSTANGVLGAGNFLDDIFLGTEPCVTPEKTVSPEGEVSVGDELTYEVTVKNSGGDVAADMVIEDEIPEGTKYVPGSMKILSGPKAGDVTDEDDEDAGHFAEEKVTINVGDLPNTTILPEGVTVQFKVVTLEEHAGKEVVNEANVTHKNLLTGKEHETPTNITNTPIEFKEPKLDSKKTAVLQEKAEGNTDEENIEVGDTLRYTITTNNTVVGSKVENLVISDEIPEGLTYVPGSLEVDGVEVTDVEDEDAGHVIDGKVIGIFGDIIDTDEHSVTFLVTVKEGQAGEEIKNVATVEGDNIPTDNPEDKVKVYPREPVLDAEKSAENLDRDKEKMEVGDTIVYTIKARNTVSDSHVSNLTIVDEIPEGLEYVEGSLVVSHEGTGTFEGGVVSASFGDAKDTEWRIVAFQAKVLPGQADEEIINIATVSGDNITTYKPKKKVKIYPRKPVLESQKLAANLEKDKEGFEVGNTVEYTIRARNTVADSSVENLTITDELPEGLEFVADSIEASHKGKAEFNDGKLVVNFGKVEDTAWRSVTFEATIQSNQQGKAIKNIAVVSGDNTEPHKPEVQIEVGETDSIPPKSEDEKDPTPDKDIKESGTKDSEITKSEAGSSLPKTATSIYTYVLVGILLVLAGFGLVVMKRMNTRSH